MLCISKEDNEFRIVMNKHLRKNDVNLYMLLRVPDE